jgi:hypothetical protein
MNCMTGGRPLKAHSLSLHWLLLVFSVSVSWAQTRSVSGAVKDTSGAVIAGATVVVASPERGITRQMSTNSTGEYNQSALPAGNYNIVVTAAGFTKYQAKGAILDVAQKARVDVTLQVGTIADEIDVEGSTVATVPYS